MNTSYRLDYVLMLAQEKNMTRAAERLFISQPTLTKYINRLEEELGVKLFDRTVSPIQVTKAGIVFIEDMKRIQDREAALRAKLLEIGKEKSTIRLGIAQVRGEYLLPSAVQRFLEKYPGVSVSVDARLEDTTEKAVAAGELDVAVGILSSAYESLDYRLLQEYEIFLLLPRSRMERELLPGEGTIEHPCVVNPEVLNGKRALLPRRGGGQYQAAAAALEKHNIVPAGQIQGANLHTLYQLVARGCGFLFATPQDFALRFPEETKDIAFCRLGNERLTQKLYIATRREDREDPMVREIVEDLLAATDPGNR